MSKESDESFVRFVDERSPQLLRVARQLTGNADEARDLVQTALERAYRRWDSIERSDGDGYGYVRQILVNAHTDAHRGRVRWRRRAGEREEREAAVSDGERHWVSPAGASPEARVVNRETLRRELGRLTARERAAVILRFGEDLSEADVATHLGVSVGTVKSTVSRALAKLRVEQHEMAMGGGSR